RAFPLFALGLFATACGGGSTPKEAAAPPPAESAAPATSAEVKADKPAEEPPAAQGPLDKIPDKCAENQAEGICPPPRTFVKLLWGEYPMPDVALKMFAKDSPWTRVFLNRNLDAWYTSGQQSTTAKLLFDEEVIVLAHAKASSGGMVVGNGGTPYDVLRL